ncbi:MAG: hypothetical protein HOH92_08720 [Crocinitomicaceae bacterium]|nr:hypothetical protein [Crocinitomicaceae bacterium]
MRASIMATICFVSSFTMALGQDSADTRSYEAYPEAAQYEIATITDSFDEVENPFIATYLGSEFHDYFYLPFRGANGVYYDFGYRNNNLGEIPFGEFDAPYPELDAPENTSPGAKLVGGKFLIYWEYELSYVICCEGAQNSYPAWLPRISKIEHYKD